MRKAVFLAAAVLSGCATTQTILARQPIGIYASPQSQNEVVFCLAGKNRVTPLDRDDGAKIILIKNPLGRPSLAFTVYKDGTGSRIERRGKMGTIGGIWLQCLGQQVISPPAA